MPLPDLIINGVDNALYTVVLAHGAGAPMDSPFMDAFAMGLGELGLKCVRFEFPYMEQRRLDGKRRPPNRAPILLDTWRTVINHLGRNNLIIGGKSMGGRIASMVARDLEDEGHPVAGLVCLGYPFSPPGKPEKAPERIQHLRDIKTPTLILQGTRDTFGGEQLVPNLPLPKSVHVAWLKDGDHGFKPRVKSGRTEPQNWQAAIDAIVSFSKEL